MPPTKISDKHVNHVSTCPIIASSVSVSGEKVKCIKCYGLKTFNRRDDHFVIKLIHTNLDVVGQWAIKIKFKSSSGFETVRIVNQTATNTNFFESN